MARVNIEESVDRISSLPDSILGHILSFLPTNVAVSTCILLTRPRWRDLFPFSNNLDFDQSLVNNPNDTSLFMDFVDRFILLMNGRHIDKFRLKCSNAVDTLRIHSWICAALCSNVRELDLSIGRKLGETFSYVFTCNTLVVLKLETGFSLNATAFVYLPCLKTLHLRSIKDSPIQRLISSCPVLEDLLIEGVYEENEVNLSSPSLKRLAIDKYKSFCFSQYELVLDMPNLVDLRFAPRIGKGPDLKNLLDLREARIRIPYWLDAHHEFLEGLGNVQSLYLSGSVEKFFLTLDVLEELPLLKNLTRLVLTGRPYSIMSVLMKFLQCCPNLEEFVTDGSIHGGHDVPSFVPSRLKSIECAMFYNGRACSAKEEESLGYFLKNADMLEKIHIWWHSSLSHREASKKLEMTMETMKKLVKALGRSKTCEINISIC